MTLNFSKMNGAGNDFVVLDNRDAGLTLTGAQIAWLCDRHRGIGADGLLAVEPAREGADYRMRYYNADGSEAEMCGNGARCFARFVEQLHPGTLEQVSFETIAGKINASFPKNDVRINLSEPFDLALNASLDVRGEEVVVHSVNTGVPHAIVVVDDLESVAIQEDGAALRFHEQFAPKGTNVNFMQVLAPGSLAIRTYERGVEDETLACGTGMVANAIIHHQLTQQTSPISVRVQGGDTLQVGFDAESIPGGDTHYTNVTLTGPAQLVFKGEIVVPESI
ncbi:MAG: diaminopimelate epimerase [Verrucomicrobiales bacterium]|jgi:diaminopimelate epimerase